jgi:6-phosphofructokinase
MPISLKNVDPNDAIRSVPATAHDSAFGVLLGHTAVHAGMSGRTDMVVGFWNNQFTHVPIALAGPDESGSIRRARSGAACWRPRVSRETSPDPMP